MMAVAEEVWRVDVCTESVWNFLLKIILKIHKILLATSRFGKRLHTCVVGNEVGVGWWGNKGGRRDR